MIGFYLSPIVDTVGLSGRVVRALIRDGVSRQGVIRACRCVASIPVNLETGDPLSTWTLCRVQGADFTALDADVRVGRLALSTELDEPADPAIAVVLAAFGLAGLSVAGSYRAVINRVGAVLQPGFRVTGD